MNTMRYNLLPCFLLFAFAIASCGQIPDPLRNKISFANEIHSVLDSIAKMEVLLKKLPKDEVTSSFVDNEGFLFVNARKIGLLTDAGSDASIRKDSVFMNFTDGEYTQFVSITVFLLKNHIGYSMKNNLSGLFVHGYRESAENTYNDTREIMVNVDTTSKKFREQYQVLDSKENMVLVAPIDARLH